MKLVSEAMNRSIVTVAPDTRVSEALALARRAGTEHLLVLDEENLVGILCTCDLEAARPDDFAWECMTLPVLTVRPDVTLDEAALTMGDCDVGCLPVAVGGLLLGTLTDAELARAGAEVPEAHRHRHHHGHATH